MLHYTPLTNILKQRGYPYPRWYPNKMAPRQATPT